MKLVIQIPCYNEERTLPITLAALPREIEGIDRIETLVIDDGSTDRTSEVARALGVDHVIRHPRNLGLARAFMTGLRASLKAGADIVINTDADNQYRGEDAALLVRPILERRAEIVVGARPILETEHFSPAKKVLQLLGSWVVRMVSRAQVADAPSGFRAYSREAAMQLKVFSSYTYTLETIIQAGQRGMSIVSVPVRTNPDLRPSRLVRSIGRYVLRSLVTIVRIVIVYRPLRFFSLLAAAFFVPGFGLGIRFVYFYATGNGAGHVQSVILAALLMTLSFVMGALGILADLISVNRKLLEEATYQLQLLDERRPARRAQESPGQRPEQTAST